MASARAGTKAYHHKFPSTSAEEEYERKFHPQVRTNALIGTPNTPCARAGVNSMWRTCGSAKAGGGGHNVAVEQGYKYKTIRRIDPLDLLMLLDMCEEQS